jgi:hypothetical protein
MQGIAATSAIRSLSIGAFLSMLAEMMGSCHDSLASFFCQARRAAVCTHTDCIHRIPIDIFSRLVLSPIRGAEAVVSRRSWYLILHKT